MPSVAVKLYSVFFKLLFKHRLQSRMQYTLDNNNNNDNSNSFGVSTRSDESIAAANPSFVDGVATKDIHIDPLTSLSIRIFLPDTCLSSPSAQLSINARVRAINRTLNSFRSVSDDYNRRELLRRYSHGSSDVKKRSNLVDDSDLGGSYSGYVPGNEVGRRLPLMLQFHGGRFLSGSSESVANDLCDVIVV